MIVVSIQGHIGEIVELLSTEGVIIWQTPKGFNLEIAKSEYPSVYWIAASEGFLSTNIAIRDMPSSGAVILLPSETEASDAFALSLRARFFEYKTSAEAQILKEVGWPAAFESWVSEHASVFASKSAIIKLRKLDAGRLTPQTLTQAVLASLFNVEERSSVGFSLALLSGKESEIYETLGLIQNTSLETVFWGNVDREIGYNSAKPGVDDLRVWIAQTALSSLLVGLDATTVKSSAGSSVEYFLQELQLRHPDAYMSLCESEITSSLKISEIQTLEPLNLSRVNHAPQVEQVLFAMCLERLVAEPQGISSTEMQEIIRHRAKSIWYKKNENVFEALLQGARVLELVKGLDLHCSDFVSGVKRYTDEFYKVDLAYRKFVYASKGKTDLNSNFGLLSERVESAYVNGYQNKLGENWQLVLSGLDSWSKSPGVTFARDFFSEHILVPLSGKKDRIAVIISDALRYEVGMEASELLAGMGFAVKTNYLIAPIPSYTQLGMAALLPNREITLKPESKTVLVDGQPTSGIENRNRILQAAPGSPGSAVDFESLITESNLKDRLSNFNLWYVYHNKIDKVGDNAASEGSVFEAVEATFVDLELAVKKLKTAGFNKIFITADHGFLYQESSIPEHGFLSSVPEGDVTEFLNRRFVIGNGLQQSEGLKHFTSAQLGYSCDYDIQIPASSLRLRRKGSGLRFVHGGAALQEIVVPLIQLSQSSQKSVSQVDVVLSPGVPTRITTGLVALSFTQKEPLSEDLLARELRFAIYADNQRISTLETFSFAFTDPEVRNRTHSFILNMTNDLSKSVQKTAILKVESRIGQTERWADYAEIDFELANLAEKDF